MSGRFCLECGNLLNEGDSFCQKCGAKQEVLPPAAPPDSGGEKKFCANCGALMNHGDRFCDECGAEGGMPPSVGTRAEKISRAAKPSVFLRFAAKTVALIVILSVCGLGGYAANRHFVKGEPFSDIARGWMAKAGFAEKPQSSPITTLPAPTPPPISPQPAPNPPVVETPPTPLPELEYVSPTPLETPAPVYGQPAAPTPPRYWWSALDANGYSRLVSDGQGGGDPAWVTGEVMGDKVRFRSGHSTSTAIITEFSKGTLVEVTQRYASGREKYYWFKARFYGGTGWIYGEFLRIPDLPSEPSSVSAAPQPQAAPAERVPAANKKARAEQLVKEGQALWNRSDWAGAYEKFDEAYKLNPTNQVKLFRENARNNINAGNAAPSRTELTTAGGAGLTGSWALHTGAMEDTGGAKYSAESGSLKITASDATAQSVSLTIGGVFVLRWVSQFESHILPDRYGAVIDRKNTVFRKGDDGMYYAAGSEWPPLMIIQTVGNNINFMYQDDNGVFAAIMVKK